MDGINMDEFRSFTRKEYYEIWQKVKAGEELDGEEKIIGELMEQHEEFYDDWDSTDFDYEYDPEIDEVNPFLHIMMDTIVMKQITTNDPPQTRFTYNKLTARGNSHLEAVHKIATVVANEIWNIMHEEREFDEKSYIWELKQLK
ncbi:MAG: DUF1841 family protein [Ignavibacteria bacterium]|jgi:hypothetical protein